MNKKIILASASPRRRELLTQIGLDFDVVVSETEEKITSTEPAKVVEELSAQKAEAVWEKLAVSGACQAPDNSAGTDKWRSYYNRYHCAGSRYRGRLRW